ncbi:MAG TPA: hypothetical protein VGX92_08660 [Pyrinomonadaceae bacterium]|jgi:hypothetical protein|nr:hypothetical protein [Pyrinomonadaceae bacterium]
MKTSGLTKKIGGAFLAFSFLFGIGIASSVTTQAQFGNDQYSRDRYYERQQRQREREQRRRERELRRQQRRADAYGNYGYGNNGYGNDGYYNNGYGVSYQLSQTALNAGYNQGIQEGRKDRSRGERYEFRDEGDYREATKDYNSRLGDREMYRRYFRQGFENGYADGYRGY